MEKVKTKDDLLNQIKNLKIETTKLPIDEFNILKDSRDLVRDYSISVAKEWEKLLLHGLEQFGIVPDKYLENLKRIKMYQYGYMMGNQHIYIDDLYAFSIIYETEWVLEPPVACRFEWKLKMLDELIGTREWRAE